MSSDRIETADSERTSDISTQTTEHYPVSSFAQGPNFAFWMNAMSAVHVVHPSPQVEAYYLQLSEFSLPRSLLQNHSGRITGQQQFVKGLNDWALAHQESQCDDDGDKFRMGELWPLLCGAYSLIKQSTSANAKEAVQRVGVDQLIRLAFHLREECRCIVRTEEEFRLGSFPADVQPLEALPNPDAIADTLVTSPPFELPGFPGLENWDIYLQQFWGDSEDAVSLILFAGEFKRVDSRRDKNHLVMSLLTAQHHRRALGMKDRIILGATYAMGNFVIYSSWWRDEDDLAFFQHPAQILTEPWTFLQCYSFLCRLQDDVKTLHNEAESLTPDHIAQSVVRRAWRTSDPPQKEKGGSKRGRQRASKKPHQATFADDDESMELGPQEEANWRTLCDEWRKQSQEDWKRTSSTSKGASNMLTAKRLEGLGRLDPSFIIRRWNQSLDGRIDPASEITPVENE